MSALAGNNRENPESYFRNVFTKTATVLIQGCKGWKRAICYVDDGAAVSLVQTRAAESAGLSKDGQVIMEIEAVGATHQAQPLTVRKVRLKGTFPGAEEIDLVALERPKIAQQHGPRKETLVTRLHLGR